MEAKLVIECEIMTSWHQNENDFRSSIPKEWYADFDAGIHTIYIGEVIGAWKNNYFLKQIFYSKLVIAHFCVTAL